MVPGSVSGSNPQIVSVSLPQASTSQLASSWPHVNTHRFSVVLNNTETKTMHTLAMGFATVVDNIHSVSS